jgi:putative ABC transport system permease protein
MNWVAWKMLTGDRAKYFGIVFGVAFGSLLIAHQSTIFVSILRRTASQILDVADADLWVMNASTPNVDEVRPLLENDLYRVRGVPGVDWAVRLYKGQAQARLRSGDYRQVVLLGLDDPTLVGAPREYIVGGLADLKKPDAAIVDEAGFKYLFPGQPLQVGQTLEMNDHRVEIVGICKASAPFQTFPIMYMRFSQAVRCVPRERNVLSYVLAKAEPGQDPQELARRVEEHTGLRAMTTVQFAWHTVGYFLRSTGIPINFGITVALGFIVGTAIAGQTFYLFTLENLRQFGNLKAMGLSNRRIVQMILLQGLTVGLLGYGIGVGLSALFFESTKDVTHLAGFYMPIQVFVVTGLAVLFIVALSSLLSIRKVLVLEPAVVFRT